jgi:hypothetical protein
MRHAIAEAYEVDELKQIRDQALLLEMAMRMAKDTENERKACEIRLRSERRAGHLLKDMEKAKGTKGNFAGRDSSGGSITRAPEKQRQTLADLGLPKDQSSQWQKLADIPEEIFEEELARAEMPSTAGIISAYEKPKVTPVSADALWLWGRLRDFERDGLLGKSPQCLKL